MDLREQLGDIDIMLFDQLHRGRLQRGMTVLDAGCGGGRNLVYMLRQGYEVHAVDQEPAAVEQVRRLAAEIAPDVSPDRFAVASVESLPHPGALFDWVICNAVLHFARDEDHFFAMLREMARVLKPGGTFWARLMSTHGVEPLVRPRGGRRFALPSGQEVFLVDEEFLSRMTREVFRGELADPLKSTLVHGQRTMTTWVVRRGA
jgi:ubiquinone/menaquinone biosynthesis C-methylase UbiE